MLKDYTPKMQKQFENKENDWENLLENSQDDISMNENSPFAAVIDGTGKSKVVRKSAVCYVLAKDKHKLSSDRLQRVQEKEYDVDKSSKLLKLYKAKKLFLCHNTLSTREQNFTEFRKFSRKRIHMHWRLVCLSRLCTERKLCRLRIRCCLTWVSSGFDILEWNDVSATRVYEIICFSKA